MIKKCNLVLFVFILSLSLFSCNRNIKITTTNVEKEFDINDTYEGKGVKRWEDIGDTIEKPCVTDEETAIKIADAITSQLQKQGYLDSVFSDDVIYLSSSFFDIEDKVWIMTYGSYKIDEVGNKVYIPGSDFCMAISEKDGRVLRMWFY